MYFEISQSINDLIDNAKPTANDLVRAVAVDKMIAGLEALPKPTEHFESTVQAFSAGAKGIFTFPTNQ